MAEWLVRAQSADRIHAWRSTASMRLQASDFAGPGWSAPTIAVTWSVPDSTQEALWRRLGVIQLRLFATEPRPGDAVVVPLGRGGPRPYAHAVALGKIVGPLEQDRSRPAALAYPVLWRNEYVERADIPRVLASWLDVTATICRIGGGDARRAVAELLGEPAGSDPREDEYPTPPASLQFSDLVAAFEQAGTCLRGVCTTCGSVPFRTAVALVAELQPDLESLDLRRAVALPRWNDLLALTAEVAEARIEWGAVCRAWLAAARADLHLAGELGPAVLRRLRGADAETRKAWHDVLRLVLTSGASMKLRHTLHDAGIVYDAELAEQFAAQREREREEAMARRNAEERRQLEARERRRAEAQRNLHGAIRRKDLKAIRALLERGASPRLPDEAGTTPVAYAASLGDPEVLCMLGIAPSTIEAAD
jgi:hypothetical protein